MHAPMRGKGIGTMATKMITDYGFDTLGFKRIEAAVDTDNTASQKLLSTAGYQREGILQQRVTRSNGDQIDMVMLAAINQSWKRLD
jgi:RimJ/RimL family protein N-acetyltransferase